jgi:hypothetical protein
VATMVLPAQSDHRTRFHEALDALIARKAQNHTFYRRARYDEIVSALLTVKSSGMTFKEILKQEGVDYGDYTNWKRTYYVKVVENNILMKKPKRKGGDVGRGKIIVCYEDMFGLQEKTHLSTNHCGYRSLWNRCKDKYANVTQDVTKYFTRTCPKCSESNVHEPTAEVETGTQHDVINEPNQDQSTAAENKLLFVYPFPIKEDKISLISSNLTELAGDTLAAPRVDARKHRVLIHEEDQARLKPGEELNDAPIDFWMLW